MSDSVAAVRLRIGFWREARQAAELARLRPTELRPADWQAHAARCGEWEREAIAELQAMQFVEAGELVLSPDFRRRLPEAERRLPSPTPNLSPQGGEERVAAVAA